MSTEESSSLGKVRHSVFECLQLGPLPSSTEKQIATLLVGMYKLSKPF